jgi:hypothetical protein
MRRYFNPVLAALLIMAAGVCAVSALSLNVGDVSLANLVDTGEVSLALDAAPAGGLSGYRVSFSIANPSVAEIVGVDVPSWAAPDFNFSSHDATSAIIKVADVENAIGPALDLGSVTVRGKAAGSSTGITVHVDQMDDDIGGEITVADAAGTISVSQAPGNLQVTSSPVGASIFVDGELKGQTGAGGITISGLSPQVHEVKATLATYADNIRQVTVISGDTVPVSFTMQKPVTIVVRTSPVDCEVYFNSVYKGTTGPTGSVTFTGNPPGFYSVMVSKPTYYSKWINRTLAQGATSTFPFTLIQATNTIPDNTPPYGNLSVNSTPMGAKVFLNGAESDLETPGWTELDPGLYTVYVTLDGYLTPPAQTAEIVVHQQVNLDFRLSPGLPARVYIVPRTLNLGRGEGKFLAFVRLPDSYRASDVDAKSVSCEGAKAERIIRPRAFPHMFVAIFSRGELVGVVPGDQVKLTLTGKINTKGGKIAFSGSDTVKVIKVSMKGKEDTDGLEKLKDDEILRKFQPKDFT